MKTIRETIIEKRKDLDITQALLAKDIGVRAATISDFESGKAEMKSNTLDLIFERLKIQMVLKKPKSEGNSKYFQISVERFNELRTSAEWILVDYYVKDDLNTYLWENKETGETKEGLSTYPPMRKLNINGFEKTE